MNCDTGELIRLYGDMLAEGFDEVPNEFADEANKLLGDKDSVFVDMTKSTPLTSWAKGQRKNKRSKRKMAKKSRQRNRR